MLVADNATVKRSDKKSLNRTVTKLIPAGHIGEREHRRLFFLQL